MTNDGDPTSQCSMSLPGFIPHVWSRVATNLPHFEHDSWIANDPTAWESEHFRPMVPYTCSCGEGFETMVRLQWHVNQAHPPGSQHSVSLGLLPRTGGSYILYDPLTRAVCLCGLARFPISGGNKPSSTCAEACTIFLALFHARRTLHPDNSYSTLTDSLSSVYGWDKSGLPRTARATLSDKFSPVWLAVRTVLSNGGGDDSRETDTTSVSWQCTEHGRPWSDPLRWTSDVLLHRVVDTAANVATASGRHSEGKFVSIFDIPPCSPPWTVEMAGSAYSAPAEVIRSTLDTHSPSRLLRTLEQSETRLVSARGIKFAAEGMIHAEATKLLHTKTPSHVMDAGLRDALGRSACTLQNLVSVETPTACDRLYLILTGTPTRSPLKCLLCDTDAVDDNTHVKSCPATKQYRVLRFLQMAEVIASTGDSLHHDPSLRPSVSASRNEAVKLLLSDIHVAPFHERTPIHALPQTIIPPHGQDVARRFGVWDCGPGDQRVLRAVILADRAHILTDLAVQFAPQVNLAHVITSVVNHVIAHPDLYQYVRITPPALLLWLVREFDIKSEAFSTPMTCFDTSTLDDSCFDNMPTFLRGVSMHPLYLTRHPVTFDEQFSDSTPFPHNTVVSLDFPSVTSVAATRFFDKCYATAAQGNTVILVGGFRDRPTNRRVRRVLAQRAPGDNHHAMVLLTFPGRSFPAGTIRGWPESPDADEQEHPKFSMHMRFGVPTQPPAMESRQINRHANLATHPCNTQVILFSPRPSEQAEAITPERIYHLTSVLQGILVPHRTRGDRFPLLWRKWSDSSLPLRFTDIPPTSVLDPLGCIKLCMWEWDPDVTPLPPPLDGDKSPVAKARRRLLALQNDREHPFPKHVIPHDLVGFLRARTRVPASYAATAAAAVVRAGLGGQFTLERARAAMLAHVLRVLHFHTPQSVMSMRGVASIKDRCHVCNTWVVSRWGISDKHGAIAKTLINEYVRTMTATGSRRPAPFDKPRDSVHKDVLAVVRKRFTYLAHHEGILVCWACAVPVADQIHKCGATPPVDDDGSTLGEDTGGAQSGSSSRPTRACTRAPSSPQPTEHSTEAHIRACVKNILARKLHVGGLTCHYAPAAQPTRVLYGHGDIVGVPFEYRPGCSARVYLVAPALEFVKPSHGPHESFSTLQLRAYYRSTPDMQHPTPVYGSVPLCQRIQPEPPSASDPRIAPPTMRTATDTHQPTTPHTARPEDAELLRQYHRIAHIISARHAVNSERGGGSTARRILSHGFGGFSHNSRTCRDVYKSISLVAHPDKHPMRNAYYRAVADIVMEVTRRANDIVASPSSSDRAAFPPVPALDSAQFSTLVNSHRRVARDNNPLMRSATTPPVVRKDGGSLMGTTPYSSDMRRTKSLPLSSSVAPCVLESHMVSASDAFPDTTPASQRHTQTTIGDHFSDIDEDEQEDEHDSRSSDAGMDDEARPLIGDTSVSRGTYDDTDVRIATGVTDLGADADDVLSDTELPRDSRAGSSSPPRLLMAPHHGLDRPTPVAAPATPRTWLLPSPSMWLETPTSAQWRLSPISPIRESLWTPTRIRSQQMFLWMNIFPCFFDMHVDVQRIRRPVWLWILPLPIRALR